MARTRTKDYSITTRLAPHEMDLVIDALEFLIAWEEEIDENVEARKLVARLRREVHRAIGPYGDTT